ncbi:hypothetical protein Mal64_29340 [Pseudobythopirellula maris]|uniref:Uncharacterized protein n=1 Tax=Pseudobythopirellula maris TaxID=2527991 RepID=A0A5C5ZJV0_9BACT|nr:hypothetical protein [Pseudobythopirellula maris]TWT87395.1 hypothetical protein Mal64_29340 [Pseudobythopirellula maris]
MPELPATNAKPPRLFSVRSSEIAPLAALTLLVGVGFLVTLFLERMPEPDNDRALLIDIALYGIAGLQMGLCAAWAAFASSPFILRSLGGLIGAGLVAFVSAPWETVALVVPLTVGFGLWVLLTLWRNLSGWRLFVAGIDDNGRIALGSLLAWTTMAVFIAAMVGSESPTLAWKNLVATPQLSRLELFIGVFFTTLNLPALVVGYWILGPYRAPNGIDNYTPSVHTARSLFAVCLPPVATVALACWILRRSGYSLDCMPQDRALTLPPLPRLR